MKAKSIVQNNICTLFATSCLKFPESLNKLPYITRKPPICSGGITLKKITKYNTFLQVAYNMILSRNNRCLKKMKYFIQHKASELLEQNKYGITIHNSTVT